MIITYNSTIRSNQHEGLYANSLELIRLMIKLMIKSLNRNHRENITRPLQARYIPLNHGRRTLCANLIPKTTISIFCIDMRRDFWQPSICCSDPNWCVAHVLEKTRSLQIHLIWWKDRAQQGLGRDKHNHCGQISRYGRWGNHQEGFHREFLPSMILTPPSPAHHQGPMGAIDSPWEFASSGRIFVVI